jgi:uncharacterized membrane protein YfcA
MRERKRGKIEETKEQKADTEHASAATFTRSFVAGFVSGALGKYAGHPLDTIKTNMQVSSKFNSMTESVKKIVGKEGIGGLYKGAISPMIATAPIVAILFSVNDFTKRKMKLYDVSQFWKEFLPG